MTDLRQRRLGAPSLSARAALAVASVALLAGCAIQGIEWQNRQPAQALQRETAPPGSVYAGWRIYQQRCASCHGPDATGGIGGAPNLTFRLRDIGPARFVDLVLRRYDWGLPAGSAGSPRETLVDEIAERDVKGALRMPEWQGEPVVSAHIMDLYVYLAGRADGSVAPGRPGR